MSSHAKHEREGLADDLLRLGPDADTLCEGWQAADLAAHLVIRDRRPDAAIGILIAPLAARTERIQHAERDRRSWPELVERVRTGPPYPVRLGPVNEAVNTVEYYLHHEDLLRAQPAALPRQISPDLQRALWARLKIAGRVLARRAPVGVVLDAPGYGRVTLKRAPTSVTVTGSPGDLLLWVAGRQGAAEVTFDGDEISIERLKQADLHF